MFNGLKKIAEGVNDIVEPLNPLVTNMTPKNKEIATSLLDNGFSVKEVQDFVDVSRNQLDDYIELEAKVIERMNSKTATTAKAK